MLSKMLFLILIWILLIYINLLTKLKYSIIHAIFFYTFVIYDGILLKIYILFFCFCFFFPPMVAFVFIRIPHMVRAFLSQYRDWVAS